MKQYHLKIEDKFMKEIKYHCLETDKTIKQFIIEAIEKKLQEEKNNNQIIDMNEKNK